MSITVNQKRYTQYVDSLITVIERTGRIVTGLSNLRYSKQSLPSPAASTDEEVMFDVSMINQFISRRTMAKDTDTELVQNFVRNMRGLSYHELCHVMYTPPSGSEIVKWVRSSGYHGAFNMLEDQRIEMMFIAKYSSASSYFRLIVAQHIQSNPGITADDLFLLLSGRFYIPKKLRRGYRSQFAAVRGEALAAEAESIIKEYLTIVYPRDTLRARGLVQRFHAVLNKLQPQSMTVCGHDVTPSGRGAGPKVKTKDQDEAAKAVQDLIDADDESDEDDTEAEDDTEVTDAANPAAAPDEGDAEGKGSGSGGSKDAEAATDASDGSGESAEEASDGAPGDGVTDATGESTFNEPTDGPSLEELRRELQDMIEDAMNDQDIQEDVEDVMDAVNDQLSRQVELDRKSWPCESRPVTPEMVGMANRVREQVQKIRVGQEPAWLRGEYSGKLNMSRVLRRQPHELNIYDRWDDGSEEVGTMEFAIVVDASGSMDYNMVAVSQMLWILREALQRLDIPVTSGLFSDQYSLNPSTERVNHGRYDVYQSAGSTQPAELLKKSYEVLRNSPMHNRVILILTDGEWANYGQGANGAEAVIAQARREGISVGILGLDNAVDNHGLHGAEFGGDISSPTEMVKVVEDIATGILRKVAINHQMGF